MSAAIGRISAPASSGESFVEPTPESNFKLLCRSQAEQEKRVHDLVAAYVQRLSESFWISSKHTTPRNSKILGELSGLISKDPSLRVAFARECLADPRILSLDPVLSFLLPKASGR